MKIFVAGASGAIGGNLVAQLVARGHEVVGTTRSAGKIGALRALGAEPVVLDALDREAVADAVAKAEPEVVVHQLTAIGGRCGEPLPLRDEEITSPRAYIATLVTRLAIDQLRSARRGCARVADPPLPVRHLWRSGSGHALVVAAAGEARGILVDKIIVYRLIASGQDRTGESMLVTSSGWWTWTAGPPSIPARELREGHACSR
jgi:hypothetical protein